jgi:pimeloyl-ACP methyl ester carboxylesterase
MTVARLFDTVASSSPVPRRAGAERRREVEFVTASDGFPLAMEHLASSTARCATPVVLCHGLGGNRFNFDLDERHSLAAYLEDQGFDVWLVELRGHGRSKQAPVQDWNFDDHVEKDVPALVKAISERCRETPVVWVGHSLGGMVAYCLLARHPDLNESFAGLVTLGSPGDIGGPFPFIQRAAVSLSLRWLGHKPTVQASGAAALLFSPAARRIGLHRMVWVHWLNPDNMDAEVIRKTVLLGLEGLSVGTLLQWAASMRGAGLLAVSDGFDYCAGLAAIRIPILLISGVVDRLAPPDRILPVWERVGSPDKRLRAFGRRGFELRPGSDRLECNDAIDYGHEDLLLGEAAARDVFPYIAAWLRERTGGEAPKAASSSDPKRGGVR